MGSKSERSDDEAHQGPRMNLLIPSAERDERRARLCPMTVRSDVIVIAGIGSQDPAQMPLAPDDDMIHTLAPD